VKNEQKLSSQQQQQAASKEQQAMMTQTSSSSRWPGRPINMTEQMSIKAYP